MSCCCGGGSGHGCGDGAAGRDSNNEKNLMRMNWVCGMACDDGYQSSYDKACDGG